jgi:hypothetical protein
MFITDYSFWDNLLLNLVFIAVFYWLVYVLRLIANRKSWFYGIGLLVLSFLLLQHVAYFLVYQSFPKLGVVLFNEHLSFDQKEFLQNYYLLFFKDLFYAFFFFLVLKVQDFAQKSERDLKAKGRMKKELDRYRANFLTAQIYPHFVKNTLHGVVGKARKRGDSNVVDSVGLLSELMDYTTEQINAKNATVYVKKELKQVEKLLALIRLQKQNEGVIGYSKSGYSKGEKIPAITLLTFMENVFKYGVISAEHPLQISADYLAQGFVFTCRNRKKNLSSSMRSSKIGLENIKQRLDMYIPDQYELRVNEDEAYFEVLLKIRTHDETKTNNCFAG